MEIVDMQNKQNPKLAHEKNTPASLQHIPTSKISKTHYIQAY